MSGLGLAMTLGLSTRSNSSGTAPPPSGHEYLRGNDGSGNYVILRGNDGSGNYVNLSGKVS